MKRRYLLERAADVLDLPGDVIAGLPRVEIIGGQELYMENHHGILEYGDSGVVVHGGRAIVRILGENIELTAMTASELRMKGKRIFNVEFVY
jgi:sporulation protein YqfC